MLKWFVDKLTKVIFIDNNEVVVAHLGEECRRTDGWAWFVPGYGSITETAVYPNIEAAKSVVREKINRAMQELVKKLAALDKLKEE